jgi:transposase
MYSPDIILSVIDLKNENILSSRAIAKKLNISKTTVNRWYIIYKNNLSKINERIYSNKVFELIKQKKIELNKKRTDNILIMNHLINLLQKNPCMKQKDIVNDIVDNLKIKFNIKSLRLYLRKLSYTYKKPRQYIVKNIKFIDNLIETRKKFVKEIQEKNIDNVISIDECGFQKLENKTKGLSLKGTAISVSKDIQYANISLIMAITNKEILDYTVTSESVNGIIFNDFIKDVINKLGDKKNYIFLMDNVKFHKNKEVQKMITDAAS